jgi:hypothetical protein
MVRARTWAPVFLLALVHFRFVTAASDSFRLWYPQYSAIFQQILETNCSSEYSAYLSGNVSIDVEGQIGDGTSTPGEGVVQCVLASTSEFIKANMQSAGVLLGIMPFALSVLGSSSEESALLFVIAKRPVLTLLLLAGSPVVVALRPFEFKDPVGILRGREGRFHSVKLGPRWVVLMAEYIVALAALANAVHVTYQLGVGVVTMILPDVNYLPALWAATGILVHIIGALCLQSRVRVQNLKADSSAKESWFGSEFSLSSRKTITIETLPERKRFLILSWITSTSTTFHVIFGTLAFSSMQFISVRDAFGVIGRYTASVTVSRIIIMYELSGLRGAVESISEDSATEGPAGPADGMKGVPRVFTYS